MQNLLHLAIMTSLSAIWYARNKARFDNLLIPIARAWFFIRLVEMETNGLQKGSITNSVFDLLLL